ncbi:MAG: hypothetical protein JW934_14685 [Anaerolineae bacterium]|nr:hypothetical protein [Anaerolineae bacterium]
MSRSSFEWQVGGESGEWETIAEIGKKKPRRRAPWWVWAALAGVLLASAGIGYLVLRERVEKLNEQIAFQIQAVIDLEERAWNRGDVSTYLALQDDSDLKWYTEQAQIIQFKIEAENTFLLNVPLSARVQNVNVQGDVAWVETHEENALGPVRRMRFYRKTTRGWLHTAPDPAFWGQAIEYHYGDQLIFRFRKRDQPYVEPAIDALGEAFYEICRTVGCASGFKYEINVVDGYLPGGIGLNTTIVLSPWISGIPLEGEWSETMISSALYVLAFNVPQAQFSGASVHSSAPLCQAIIDEYAVWMSTHDLAQAPLLGRVIARHGERVLPQVFEYLKSSPTQSAFLSRWLALPPPAGSEQAALYFETLLNIEQEAAVAQRLSTFQLLQDDQDGVWTSYQNERFNRIGLERDGITLTPVQVRDIQVQNVTAVMSINSNPLLHSRAVAVFRLRDDGWKRNDFVSTSYQLSGAHAPTPTVVPTPTPRPQ